MFATFRTVMSVAFLVGIAMSADAAITARRLQRGGLKNNPRRPTMAGRR